MKKNFRCCYGNSSIWFVSKDSWNCLTVNRTVHTILHERFHEYNNLRLVRNAFAPSVPTVLNNYISRIGYCRCIASFSLSSSIHFLLFHYTARFFIEKFCSLGPETLRPQHLLTSLTISVHRPFSTLWTTFIPDARRICPTLLTPIRYYWFVESFFSCFPASTSPSVAFLFRFLFLSSFPTVMELRVVHARFPQWF